MIPCGADVCDDKRGAGTGVAGDDARIYGKRHNTLVDVVIYAPHDRVFKAGERARRRVMVDERDGCSCGRELLGAFARRQDIVNGDKVGLFDPAIRQEFQQFGPDANITARDVQNGDVQTGGVGFVGIAVVAEVGVDEGARDRVEVCGFVADDEAERLGLSVGGGSISGEVLVQRAAGEGKGGEVLVQRAAGEGKGGAEGGWTKWCGHRGTKNGDTRAFILGASYVLFLRFDNLTLKDDRFV